MEFLDFSEYSDPPLLTSVTTHRSLEQNRGVNDMVSASEKLRSCLTNMLECFSNFFMTGTTFWGASTLSSVSKAVCRDCRTCCGLLRTCSLVPKVRSRTLLKWNLNENLLCG